MEDFVPYRLYLENIHPNNKVERESSVHNKVQQEYQSYRSQEKSFEFKTPERNIEEYRKFREKRANRSQNIVNGRFPQISSLQQQEDSFSLTKDYLRMPQIKNLLQMNNENTQITNQYSQSTLVSHIKTKSLSNQGAYTSKNRLSKSFIPVNPIEAKSTITRTLQYDPQEYNFKQAQQKCFSSMIQKYPFKRADQSLDHIQALPVLNSKNNYTTFLGTNHEQPRLTILDNFKEINKIMTTSFLRKKDIEKQYKNSQYPLEELQRQQIEQDCTQKMTYILKKMHSPRNFCSPLKKNIESLNKIQIKSKRDQSKSTLLNDSSISPNVGNTRINSDTKISGYSEQPYEDNPESENNEEKCRSIDRFNYKTIN